MGGSSLSALTTDQQNTVLLRHSRRIVDYLQGHGIQNEQQRIALIALAEGWDKLSFNGKWDDALEAKLRSRPGLFDFSPAPKLEPKVKPAAMGKILLNVPYWKQTDNYRDANRTCFSSSMAMIIEFLKPDELPDDDTYVETVFSIGDTTDPGVQVKALDRHGVKGTYRQDMGFDLLDRELEAGFPVGVAILHRGPLSAPAGGHWVICRGRNEDKSQYYFNDPYGSLNNAYTGPVEEGQCVAYDRHVLEARWTVEGGNSGWGMTCRKE